MSSTTTTPNSMGFQRGQFSQINICGGRQQQQQLQQQQEKEKEQQYCTTTTATLTTAAATTAAAITPNRQNSFNNDEDDIICGSDDGPTVVSELLLKDSHSSSSSTCSGVLNSGEDDEMQITGYRRSKFRTMICWFFVIITFGLLRLFMHWWRHWYLLATHSSCPLDCAEKVLIREDYEGKHSVYYVKDVITLNSETLKKMQTEKEKWEYFFPLDENFEENQFQLSIHFSSGNFKHMDIVRLFRCKQLRYIWDIQTQNFQKLKGLDVNVPSSYLHQRKGLSKSEEYSRRLVYGANQIAIPIKGVLTLLFLEVLNPFYCFQVFSVCLWISYNYYYYAIVIILMSAFGITMSIIQTKKNQQALRSTVQNSDYAIVIHDDGQTEHVETKCLVPGDLIEIPTSGCTMQCDAVLLSGNCILDESMLTGESVPVTKTPLPYKRDLIFDIKEHSRHMLYSGTKVIQTRYIGSEKVLAVVINTGNITAKGGLIRSILYPPPVDYKFEQDSYKFIALLGLIAGVGFIYTLITKIVRGVSAAKIAIESLDLITIAVPPALPAAMTVGRFYAQKRLETKNIYCISPRSINVSGSIDCVCFDKTGTLTEDGLDMWGVVPKTKTNQFQMPLRQIDRLPFDHFLYGMVTCHSITIMNGDLKGDPLDLKMFESTGWILEEAANVADDNKYDLLFPTIVRQPKLNNSQDNLYKKNYPKNNNDNNDDDTDPDLIMDEESNNDIGIVREFSFTSTLQRMSVITRLLSDNHFNVYCKGSPEMIQTLCRPDTIPDNYMNQLDIYAQQGYRIIAVAYKPLDKKMTYPRIQRIGRDRIECDLEFQGFVILENRLKPDTTDVIKSLINANIRTIMVTGDNILTALSVAKDCGIIGKKQSVITVNTRSITTIQNETDETDVKYELYYNLTGYSGQQQQQQQQQHHHQQPQLLNSTSSCCNNIFEMTTPNGNGDISSLITTNSNSVASLETIDTWTHRDIEIGSKHMNYNHQQQNDNKKMVINRKNRTTNDQSIGGGGDIGDGGTCIGGGGYDQLKMLPDLPNNNYRFAMDGKTWSIIRDHFPDLLSKFVTRGTIFARMSPEQKQSLIIELQDLGYYVAMCGDGANDCGALKAAHTGISLSEAESSVASPFTSKNPTIACVPNVIKEGRAALVTSFGIFKYMAAYSLVQFTSVLILYSIDSNLTDIEFLYIDLFLISVFAFFFGKTEAYDGPLCKETPISSLIAFSPIASLLLHIFVATIFQIIGWYHLHSQEWFRSFELVNDFELGCTENYTIFIISCFQYIILAFIFSKGKPYRKSITSNWWFLITIIVNTIIVVYLAIVPAQLIADYFELILPPATDFRFYLLIYGLLNFLISLFIEEFIIDYIFIKKLRYRYHNIDKSRRKYLQIENSLRLNLKWPQIVQFQNDYMLQQNQMLLTNLTHQTIYNNNITASPISYAEIGAEHGIDINKQFDQNSSVLNNFFTTKLNHDIDSDGDDDDLDTYDDFDNDDDDYGDNNFIVDNKSSPISTITPSIATTQYVNNNTTNNNNLQSSRNDSGIDFEMLLNGQQQMLPALTSIQQQQPQSSAMTTIMKQNQLVEPILLKTLQNYIPREESSQQQKKNMIDETRIMNLNNSSLNINYENEKLKKSSLSTMNGCGTTTSNITSITSSNQSSSSPQTSLTNSYNTRRQSVDNSNSSSTSANEFVINIVETDDNFLKTTPTPTTVLPEQQIIICNSSEKSSKLNDLPQS